MIIITIPSGPPLSMHNDPHPPLPRLTEGKLRSGYDKMDLNGSGGVPVVQDRGNFAMTCCSRVRLLVQKKTRRLVPRLKKDMQAFPVYPFSYGSARYPPPPPGMWILRTLFLRRTSFAVDRLLLSWVYQCFDEIAMTHKTP